LATTHSNLSSEALGWDPSTVSRGSSKKETWLCPNGHKWKAVVSSRVHGAGCPKCSGRTPELGETDLATTHPILAAQVVGWDPKKYSAGSGAKLLWRCQKGHEWKSTVVGRAANNLGCPICSNRVILPGFNDLATTHPELAQQANGWDPMKVTAGLMVRKKWKCSIGHEWESTINNRSTSVKRTGKTTCPICTGEKILAGFNDLGTKRPEVARFAVGWDPSTRAVSSHEKLPWKCDLGHKYLMAISNKTFKENGCPYCSNSLVLAGFNDLATTHPIIASEAVGWDPAQVLGGTARKLKWRCVVGHEWVAQVNGRTQGNGCPTCAKYGYDVNENGFLYLLIHDDWNLFQIGITNNPKSRLAKHFRKGWSLIELRGPMDGLIAREWESSILQMLKHHGAELATENVAGKFDGYTEAWLTDTYKANSLRELMDMVDADEA